MTNYDILKAAYDAYKADPNPYTSQAMFRKHNEVTGNPHEHSYTCGNCIARVLRQTEIWLNENEPTLE